MFGTLQTADVSVAKVVAQLVNLRKGKGERNHHHRRRTRQESAGEASQGERGRGGGKAQKQAYKPKLGGKPTRNKQIVGRQLGKREGGEGGPKK